MNHRRTTKSMRPAQLRYPVSVRPYVSLLFAMAVLLLFSTAEICAQTAGTGKADYQNYCAGCHGTDGTGAKDVDIPGPDLTHLSKKNGGRFPFQEVYDVIDGRKLAAAHKRLLSMPLWGVYFQPQGVSKGASEAEVKSRITTLVRYIQSLQSTGTATSTGTQQ
jgi:mono/diheme cytochrome c family protein